jgi:hypothetical protein
LDPSDQGSIVFNNKANQKKPRMENILGEFFPLENILSSNTYPYYSKIFQRNGFFPFEKEVSKAC